jgi:O-methyltransferase
MSQITVAPKLAHNLAIAAFYAPPEVIRFLDPAIGADYDISVPEKLDFIGKVYRNSSRPDSLSSFLEQLALVRAVFSIPSSCEGAVAEFGCFKGYSTATLSLACRRTGRRLFVFDSFEGLPDPGNPLTHLHDGSVLTYQKGELAGSLDEVKANVTRYGAIEVCEFVKGFFENTLPLRPADEKYCLIFEDADLPSSVKTIIHHAWPRLQDGCTFFTHEARDLEVAKIFFDDDYWRQETGRDAPGMIGSGLGLSYSLIGSCMGVVVKRP